MWGINSNLYIPGECWHFIISHFPTFFLLSGPQCDLWLLIGNQTKYQMRISDMVPPSDWTLAPSTGLWLADIRDHTEYSFASLLDTRVLAYKQGLTPSQNTAQWYHQYEYQPWNFIYHILPMHFKLFSLTCSLARQRMFRAAMSRCGKSARSFSEFSFVMSASWLLMTASSASSLAPALARLRSTTRMSLLLSRSMLWTLRSIAIMDHGLWLVSYPLTGFSLVSQSQYELLIGGKFISRKSCFAHAALILQLFVCWAWEIWNGIIIFNNLRKLSSSCAVTCHLRRGMSFTYFFLSIIQNISQRTKVWIILRKYFSSQLS